MGPEPLHSLPYLINVMPGADRQQRHNHGLRPLVSGQLSGKLSLVRDSLCPTG